MPKHSEEVNKSNTHMNTVRLAFNKIFTSGRVFESSSKNEAIHKVNSLIKLSNMLNDCAPQHYGNAIALFMGHSYSREVK